MEATATTIDTRSPLTAPALVTVNGIEVIYNHVILVLKGVSLAVPEGSVVVLPAPLPPRMATMPPSGTLSDTPLSTRITWL